MKTVKPIIAGILSIAAGAFNILVGLGAWRRAELAQRLLVRGALHGFGLLAVVLGIVAIIGGTFALRRKVWGMALTGTICALFPPATILGIPAIILLSLSKTEFTSAASRPPPSPPPAQSAP